MSGMLVPPILPTRTPPEGCTSCHKCGGTGTYVWVSFGSYHQGKCNRCNGKGWQDATDREKNRRYDRRIEIMTERTGEQPDGERYADWVPHWCPDPENLKDPTLAPRRLERHARQGRK